jgi:hypothetical protein
MEDEQVETPAEEVQPEQELTAEELFSAKLNELRAEKSKPAETEEVAADADVDGEPEADEVETPEAKPEPVKVEGTTAAMRLLAKQNGVDDRVIKLTTNDDQLTELIEHAIQSREEANKAEIEPATELANILPEDEFGADDPVRKQVDAIIGEVKTLRDDVVSIVNWALGQVKVQEQSREAQIASQLGSFDSHLDTFDNPVLGNKQSGTHNNDVRAAVWNKFWNLKEEKPQATDAELINEAAAAFGYKTKKQTRTEAIKDDNANRLGGSGTKPLPEPQLEGKELALSLMRKALAKTK